MMMRKTELVRSADRSTIATGGLESGSISAEGTIMNWVRGFVHSQYAGLVGCGVRVKVGARADLRIRWTKQEERRFIVGHPVVAMMSARAVSLESGLFRRSKQRWNRWVGRIVLIEQVEAGVVYTVKVHGEEWTMKSLGPVIGTPQPPRPWDVVNIVGDPQAVEVSIDATRLILRNT